MRHVDASTSRHSLLSFFPIRRILVNGSTQPADFFSVQCLRMQGLLQGKSSSVNCQPNLAINGGKEGNSNTGRLRRATYPQQVGRASEPYGSSGEESFGR